MITAHNFSFCLSSPPAIYLEMTPTLSTVEMWLKQKQIRRTIFPFYFSSIYFWVLNFHTALQAPPHRLSANQDLMHLTGVGYNRAPTQSVCMLFPRRPVAPLPPSPPRCLHPFTSGTRLYLTTTYHHRLDTRGEFISRQTSWTHRHHEVQLYDV